MDIKVRTNISSEYQNIEVCINAPERNEEVQNLENELLLKSAKNIETIIGMQNNDIFILNTLLLFLHSIYLLSFFLK